MFCFAAAYTLLKGKDLSCKLPLEVSLNTLAVGSFVEHTGSGKFNPSSISVLFCQYYSTNFPSLTLYNFNKRQRL
jgi:hypothetical protein